MFCRIEPVYIGLAAPEISYLAIVTASQYFSCSLSPHLIPIYLKRFSIVWQYVLRNVIPVVRVKLIYVFNIPFTET